MYSVYLGIEIVIDEIHGLSEHEVDVIHPTI